MYSKVGMTLFRYIAESFQIPILVTNQITTKVSHDIDMEEGSVVTAALGNSWSHAVNTRLLMQYREGNKRMVRKCINSHHSAC